MRLFVLVGALLAAAPLFPDSVPAGDPRVRNGKLVWFELNETRDAVVARMGQPAMVAPFGPDFVSWQYKGGTDDHDGFSHYLVFRRSDGKLAGITRNYDEEQDVAVLFPAARTVTYHLKEGGRTIYSVRVRRLAGDRALIAMGAAKPGDTTSQIMLIRVRELKYFYPWLYEQLRAAGVAAE